MNVLFVNYHNFTANSAVHIFNLANKLVERGVSCSVCVPDHAETVAVLGVPRFPCLDFSDVRRGRLAFPNEGRPTLIHAWTPRECVREITELLAERYGCRFVVHLEDNEELLTARFLQVSPSELRFVPAERLDQLVGSTMCHPIRYRDFLDRAAGVTVLIDRLFDFKPPGIPGEVIWPGFDEELFRPLPPDPELRGRLGIPDGAHVVVYPGNVHAANVAEVRSLYLAVGALNRAGLLVKLVRLGRDFVDLLDGSLATLRHHVIDIGYRPHVEIPRFLALADVLVQPGRSDAFNDYRLPAKLPEFLAMGLPVILPNTNIGRHLADGEECLLLKEGSALEIAAGLERLFKDPKLRRRLGRAARAFAEKHLSWSKSAATLYNFYERIASSSLTVLGDQSALDRIAERYAAFTPAPIAYATVEDYSDSVDHLPALATLNGDLKDVQRPWVLKAVLGQVPRGARLLEIGAGDPWVADLLTRLGYQVCVVDPYDGRDNGPANFHLIQRRYPKIRFVRGVFPDALAAMVDPVFDCIYSISVLEHIPDEAIAKVVDGIKRYTSGTVTIHAIDHVLKGIGSDTHLTKLLRIISRLGFFEDELGGLLKRLEDDPDAYFLSAEAHNRWRGSRPYHEFPMRRVVSIHVCARLR